MDTLRLITLVACELLDTCSYYEYHFFFYVTLFFCLFLNIIFSKEYALGVYSSTKSMC